jgi:exodeoxyribonuclease VII small subunit
MPNKKNAVKQIDFGQSFRELEEIINWFTSEEVDLDQGLKKFERGLELAQICRTRLKEVENRVNELKIKFGELENN